MDTEMPAQTARMHQTLDPVVRILNVVFRLDMFDRHNLIGINGGGLEVLGP